MMGTVSDIDLRLLRVFVAVVRSGGFSLAAARLNVAESTVSSHMSDLETRLGIRLCERGRSGFRLTNRGQAVFDATVDLLERLEEYRDKLSGVSQCVSDVFRIGVPDAVLNNPALPVAVWLRRFSERFPHTHLDLRVLGPRELEQQVTEELLHVAVAPEHRRVAGLEYQPICGELNLLYCSERHPLYGMPDEAITEAMLEEAGLISRGYLERFDAAFFRNMSHRATVHDIEGAAHLIATGRFVGFLPAPFVEAYRWPVPVRAVCRDRIQMTVTFSLIIKRSRQGQGGIEAFRKLVDLPQVLEAKPA